MNANLGLNTTERAILALVAGGDLAAQRALAGEASKTVSQAHANRGSTQYAVFEAVMWARLAAAHGDEDDALRLSGALITAAQRLGEQGDSGIAHGMAAEAIAIVRVLMDRAYAPAIQVFESTVQDIAPTIIQKSTQILEEALRAQAHSIAPSAGA